MSDTLTHRVAVIGFVYDGDRFLLLKRNNPPLVWGPPGGRLAMHEDPVAGLHREIMEETGLHTDIVGLAGTWFGDLGDGEPLLSIDYLAAYRGGEVKLSAEHAAYAWVTIEQLAAGDPVALDSDIGFKLADFEHARDLAGFYCK